MESLDFWRLCDEVSIVQAALLIAGEDPSSTAAYVEGWNIEKRPLGYEAAKTALTNAVKAGVIDAKIVPEEKWYSCIEDYGAIDGTVDITLTMLSVASIKEFLKSRGFHSGFFFPQSDNGCVGYLDAQHPHYSPKLAAAIGAWTATSESRGEATGKSIKQAITIWLRSNAGRFGLIKDDGNPNESGIDEVAKVANWETKGGAPKTPGG